MIAAPDVSPGLALHRGSIPRMAPFLATFAGVGLLLILLSIPLLRRRVPPNSWYGLRVAATFADERVWYEANAHGARDLMLVGGLQIVLAVLLLPLRLPEDVYVLLNAGALVIGVVTAAIVGTRRANRLLRERALEAVPAK